MDIRLSFRNISSHGLWSCPRTQKGLKPCCSGKDSQQNGDSNSNSGAEDIDLESYYDSFLSGVVLHSKDDRPSPRIVHSYHQVTSGFVARLSSDKVKELEKKDRFILASPQTMLALHTTHTPICWHANTILAILQNLGDKFSTDWDKAWSSFRKRSKKNIFSNIFSQFSPNKYVTWNPKRSDYPLSEEVDPIKRTEKSNLMLWTSPQFTLVGAIIIVTFLLVYSILAITK